MDEKSGIRYVINGIEIIIYGVEDMSEKEILEYIKHIRQEYPKETLTELIITVGDDNKVDLDFTLKPPKFHRIRRITGYLVGSMDRWGNAKRAEEHDRVKHTF